MQQNTTAAPVPAGQAYGNNASQTPSWFKDGGGKKGGKNRNRGAGEAKGELEQGRRLAKAGTAPLLHPRPASKRSPWSQL